MLFWDISKKTSARKNSSKLLKNSIIRQLQLVISQEKILKLIDFSQNFSQSEELGKKGILGKHQSCWPKNITSKLYSRYAIVLFWRYLFIRSSSSRDPFSYAKIYNIHILNFNINGMFFVSHD